MTETALHHRLAAAAGSRLALDAEALGSAALAELLGAYLGSPAVVLEQVRIEPAAGGVLLRGVAAGGRELEVEAAPDPRGGRAVVRVAAPCPVPRLLPALRGPLFDRLELEETVLALAPDEGGGSGGRPAATLRGRVRPAGPLAGAARWIPAGEGVVVQGTVRAGARPEVALSAPLAGAVELPTVLGDLRLESPALFLGTVALAGGWSVDVAELRGTATVGSLALPLALGLPGGAAGWWLRLAAPTPLPRLADVLALLSGAGTVALPDELAALPRVVLRDLELAADPDGIVPTRVALELEAPGVWTLVPGALALAAPRVRLEVHAGEHAGGAALPFAAAVCGTVRLGTLDFPVGAAVTAGGACRVELGLGVDDPLPGLAELAALVNLDLAGWLPEGLAAGGLLCVERAALEVHLPSASLTGLSASLGLVKRWELLPGLAVRDAGVDLAVRRGADGALGVSGRLAGVAVLGGVELHLAGALPGGRLEASIPEVRVREVAAQLCPPGSPLLDALPDLVFRGLEAVADAGDGVLWLAGDCTGRWEVVPGWLALEEMEMELEVDAEGVHGSVRGVVEVAGVDVELSARIPAAGETWRFTGATAPGETISLRALAAALAAHAGATLPEGLPDLSLAEVAVTADAGGEFSLRTAGRLQARLPLGGGEVAAAVALDLCSSPGPGGTRSWRGGLRGTVELGAGPLALEWDFTGASTFRAWLEPGRSLELLAALPALLPAGAELPPELPACTLSALDLSATPATGAFRVTGTAAGRWSPGGQTLGARVDVALSRAAGGAAPTTGTISLHAGGSVGLADELALGQVELVITRGAAAWSVSGSARARVYGHELALDASLARGADAATTLTLSSRHSPPARLVELPGVGSFELAWFTFEVTRPADAGAPPSWRVAGAGALRVPPVVELDGALELFSRGDGEAGLRFRPARAAVSLPLPGEPGGSLELDFGPVTLERRDGAWSFEARVTTACPAFHAALPELLRARFPRQVTATFHAGAGGVTLRADRLLEPLDVELPPVQGEGGAPLALGTLRLDARDLAVTIGKDVSVSLELGLGLPAGLNRVFGMKDGAVPPEPRMRLLRTFDPADPEASTLRLRLTAGTEGVRAVLLSSPLLAVRFEMDGGRSWWRVDLGDFGEVRLQVPEFAYDVAGGRFLARGGFETVRPLAVPLAPARALLRAGGHPGLADALPSSVPLRDLTLLDDEQRLRVDELAALLGAGLPGGLPDAGRQALETLAAQAARLPRDLRAYLDLRLPQSFHFELGVTPDGGVRLDVGVHEGDDPLRILFPFPGPVPALQGIELRKLAFGSVLGGNLFLLQADLRCDQWDLASLAAALLIPEGSVPLAPAGELQTRVIIDDLFVLIVPQTQVPVPVPLFFDELGVERKGLEGVGVQAHVSFPMPRVDMAAAARTLAGFVRFVRDRDAMLDPEALGPLDTRLALGKTYLKLPEYLGGGRLGHDGPPLEVRAYATAARALNALKTLRVNDVVGALPLEHRVGSSTVTFGPLSATVRWLLTTPPEFRAGAWARLGELPGGTEPLLALLPAGTAGDEQGLVLFLAGSGALKGFAEVDASFGLAASGTGFGTGFRLAGRLAGVVDAELGGRVVVDAGAPAAGRPVFGVDGHAWLALAGHRVFTGTVHARDRAFVLDGTLDLFPPPSPLRVHGAFQGELSPGSVLLAGAMEVTLAGLQLAAVQARLEERRLYLRGTWLGQTLELEAGDAGGVPRLHGGMPSALALGDVFRLSAAEDDARGPWVSVRGGPDPAVELSCRVTLLGASQSARVALRADGFSVKLAGCSLYGLFACDAEVWGPSLGSLGDLGFRVSVGSGLGELDALVRAEVQRRFAQAQQALADARRDRDLVLDQVRDRVREDRRQALTAVRAQFVGQADQVRDELSRVNADLGNRLAEADAALAQVRNPLQEALNHAAGAVPALEEELRRHDEWYAALPLASWNPFEATRVRDAIPYGLRRRTLADAVLVARGTLAAAQFALDNLRIPPAVIELNRAVQQLTDSAALHRGVLEGITRQLQDTEAALNQVDDWAHQAVKDLSDPALDAAGLAVAQAQATLDAVSAFGEWLTADPGGSPVVVEAVTFSGVLGSVSGRRFSVTAQLRVTRPGEAPVSRTAGFELDFDDLAATAARLVKQELGL